MSAIRRQIHRRGFSAATKAAMERLLKGETYRAAADAEGIDYRHLARRAATVPWLRDAHNEARPEPACRAGTWPAGFRERRRAERTEAGLRLKARNRARQGDAAMPVGITAALQDATSAALRVFTSDGLCFEAKLDEVRKAHANHFKAKTP